MNNFGNSLLGLLSAVLLLFFVMRGVIPAFTEISTDFPNYYTAAHLLRHGADLSRIYDDRWFQEQMRLLGFHQPGKFSPFPPATALFYVPFTFLSSPNALRAVSLLNMLLLAGCFLLLRRLVEWRPLTVATFLLLSGSGLANCIRFGQMYLLLAFLMIAAVVLRRRHVSFLAGISAGLLLPVKYASVVSVIDFCLRRNWRAAAGAALSSGAVVLAGLFAFGVDVHADFVRSVLPNHFQGILSGQDPFSASFQSFDSLLKRLFVYDDLLNPTPAFNAPILVPALKISIMVVVLASTVASVLRLIRQQHDAELPVAILTLAFLLLAPATASYHFVLLWLPIAVLLHHFESRNESGRYWLTLLSYAAIGFLPLSFFRTFEGDGSLSILAYPRLMLMIMLFWLGVSATFSATPRTESRIATLR